MPRTFTSPAFFTQGALPVALPSRHALAMHLGHIVGGVDVDQRVDVLWKMAVPAPVEWAELAIAVGEPQLDTSPLRYVGALDVSELFATAQVNQRVRSVIPISVPIEWDGDLWLVAVTKQAEGVGTWPVSLVGSSWNDPINSGLVAQANGHEQRPSHYLGLGQVMAFNAHVPMLRPLHWVAQLT